MGDGSFACLSKQRHSDDLLFARTVERQEITPQAAVRRLRMNHLAMNTLTADQEGCQIIIASEK